MELIDGLGNVEYAGLGYVTQLTIDVLRDLPQPQTADYSDGTTEAVLDAGTEVSSSPDVNDIKA